MRQRSFRIPTKRLDEFLKMLPRGFSATQFLADGFHVIVIVTYVISTTPGALNSKREKYISDTWVTIENLVKVLNGPRPATDRQRAYMAELGLSRHNDPALTLEEGIRLIGAAVERRRAVRSCRNWSYDHDDGYDYDDELDPLNN